MNNWNFTGRLGRDAEVRFLPNGDAITSFSVAVDFGYGEKKGSIWPRCTMFGKRGEAVAPYLKKGTQVAISGELAQNKWTNKEGVEQLSLEVRVNDLTLVGGKTGEPNEAPAKTKAASATPDDFDSDVPF